MTSNPKFSAPNVEDRSSLALVMAHENALEYGPQVLEYHGVTAAELALWEAARTRQPLPAPGTKNIDGVCAIDQDADLS